MALKKVRAKFGGVSVLEGGREIQVHFAVPSEYKPEYLITQAGLSRVVHVGLKRNRAFAGKRSALVFEVRESK